jgi:23S rRNA (cytosine1962-C5)-methyltransferase
VRLYQWNQRQSLDAAWIESQLQQAIDLRRHWMDRHHHLDAVRWVNSEGDGLSGLIVDQFGDHLVVQLTARAMHVWEPVLVEWFQKQLSPEGIVVRIDANTAKAEGLEAREQWVIGAAPNGPFEINENGVRLRLDFAKGQKTGYYLDQRANRRRAAAWMGSGPMLDVCCYLAGFSLAAHAAVHPESITAVDSSSKVLEQAQVNAQLNAASIDFVQADCFDYLTELVNSNQTFETVVLDPPRMASSHGSVQAALRAYHRLNLSAVRLLRPGGILVTCSCSGRVSRSDFSGMLAAIAGRTGRNIQIIENLGADFDHPIMAQCPESEYLKCLICRVC